MVYPTYLTVRNSKLVTGFDSCQSTVAESSIHAGTPSLVVQDAVPLVE